jgi:tetratricopeptide (TPR) repeat protein
MKKYVVLLVPLVLTTLLAAPRSGAVGVSQHSVPSAAAGSIAAAGPDLLKLLPRSTAIVLVVDPQRFMDIDDIAAAMQAPKFKADYDEFVRSSGIDPQKDVAYVAFGMTLPADPDQIFNLSRSKPPLGVFVIKLKYDQSRLFALLKEKLPDAGPELYKEVAIYPPLYLGGTPTTLSVRAGDGQKGFRIAFLDSSHLVLGSDIDIRAVIDVYRETSEPLAKDPGMTDLVGRVDKSGMAWCAVAYPAEFIKKFVEAKPQLEAIETLKGAILAFDNEASELTINIRVIGGGKEQNMRAAATFNGLKFILAMKYAKEEPALAELLNGIAVTSGEDYTRATLTVSHETLGRLWKLAGSKKAGWKVLAAEADDLYSEGEFERGLETGLRALDAAEKALGPDHQDLAPILHNVAILYIRQGRPEAAGPLLRRALAITEKVLGPDDPALAEILQSLAVICISQRQDTEAEALLKRSVAIKEKTLGPEHPDLAKALVALALVYQLQGRDPEAEPLLRRALTITDKAAGPVDLQAAMALTSMAHFYYGRHQYAEAEPLYKRALPVIEKEAGPDDPGLAMSLNELGVICHVQGRYAEAEPLYKRLLAIQERTLGPDSPGLIDTLRLLAELYRAANRPKDAEETTARITRIQAIKR